MIETTQRVFTHDEAMELSRQYFNGEELPANIFINKYAMRNKGGDILESTPDDMHKRMAREFARIEDYNVKYTTAHHSKYGINRKFLTEDRIYEYFKEFKYIIPQGSIMSSLGNPHTIASLSNCTVLPEVFDSYGGIIYTDQQQAQLMKRRCGVGIDISTLRPAKTTVTNAAGSSTGPVSFMHRFSGTTREVAQDGRRGALMLTINVAHPDVEQFVTVKQDLNQVTGANISVCLSDEFMQAVENNTEYTHRWPIDSPNPTITKTIRARDLWDTIIKCAHNTAEPGLIFWDRQHKYSTSSIYPGYKNTSTNPCSEIAMQGGDSCRLIAMNLYSFVTDPFTDHAMFDEKKFYEVTYEAQRLMDDLVELELEAIDRIIAKIHADPEPDHIKQIELDLWHLFYETGKKGRRTGLGFTALADCLAAMGLKYDSYEAGQAIEAIMRIKLTAEFDSSIDMAIERGHFYGFDSTIDNTSEFVQMMANDFPDQYARMMKHGRRNISLSTVAPTGTLSNLTQTSSGMEPVFMMSYRRRKKINPSDKSAKVDFVDAQGDKWQEFQVYHPKEKVWMDVTGHTDESLSPYAGATAPEIDWIKRVAIQAIIQKYTTHSISSTINLPADVSPEKVGEIYMYSWKAGLKGITVYRDGSRSGVLISDKKEEKKDVSVENHAKKRPKTLDCDVVRFVNNKEKWIGFVGLLDGRPYEIFTGQVEGMGIAASVERGQITKVKTPTGNRYYFKAAGDGDAELPGLELSRCFDKHYHSYAKLISAMLRHNMPLHSAITLIDSLEFDKDNIVTWKAGVMRALKRYIADGTKAADKTCKDCGAADSVVYEEGCLKCTSCGSSKCG